MSPLRRPRASIAVPSLTGDPGSVDDHAPPGGGDGPPQVPRDTSPTWELELLISGAVIFALLQLPPLVDAASDWLTPRLSLSQFAVATMVRVYAKAILYALIASFILHLSARAYWVSLVGLDSVFPGGVRWDQVRLGPIVREVYGERLPRLRTVIERTDNVCSVIFATGFLVAFLFAVSLAMAAVVAGASLLVSELVLGGRWMVHLFAATFGLLFVVPVLAAGVDKVWGARLAPGGTGRRLVRAVGAANFRVSMMAVYAPISMTLFSNIRKRVIYPVFYLFSFGLMGAVVLEQRLQAGKLTLDGYAYVPGDAGGMEVDPRVYGDQRVGRDRYSTLPFVQSDVIREPYVRLFIPYVPVRHNDALARECPGARPGGAVDASRAAREAAAAATLGCLARIHALRVNGRPRPDLELRFYTHPETEMKGMLVYVATEGLPRGRNVITVRRPVAEPPAFVRAPKHPVEEHEIPFWL